MLFDENSIGNNNNGSLKFLANQGLTVDAIRKKKIIISQKGCKDVAFQSETDNVSRYIQILNMVCVPLFDEGKSVVAVMQLLNKKDGEITDKDRVVL